MWDPDNLSTNGLLVIYVLFFKCIHARAGRSPRRESEWLMLWYHADWLHGCIPWKNGWGTDEVYRCGAITASLDILQFMPPPPRIGPPSTYTLCRLKQTEGRGPLGINSDPCLSPVVLLLCLVANGGVSRPRPAVYRMLSMAIVLWHGRFAGRRVTCGPRLPLSSCSGLG